MNKKFKITFATIFAALILGVSSCGTPSASGHTHTFETTWTNDAAHHWHTCTGCDEVADKAAHTFGEWNVTKEATIIEGGSRERACTVCQYKEVEATSPLNFPTDFLIPFHDVESRVYLPYTSSEIFVGSTYNVSPVVINSDNKNIEYQISDNSVISVNDSGIVTGLKAGGAYLRAYNDLDEDKVLDSNEPFAVMSFSVLNPDSNVVFTADKQEINLQVGQTTTVTPTITGISAQGFDFGYYSEDSEIVTASKGKINAHKEGNTNIFITCKGYKLTIPVTVTSYKDNDGLRATGIVFEDDAVNLNNGDTYQIRYNIVPQGNIDTLATCTSNNEEVATVSDSGLVTAHKPGSAVITLTTSNGKIARKLITVKADSKTYSDYYNNYYNNLTWENGDDLINKLHAIISTGVTPLRYDSPNWETNQYADEYFYDSSRVNLVYANDTLPKDSHGTSGAVWQREHAFAASLMTGFSTGVAVTNYGRATDFHNLFAAKGAVNGSRGNKNFGYVDPNSADYEAKEICGYDRSFFEPTDKDKGRLARAIFYMAVMYNTTETGTVKETWTYSGKDIETHTGKTTRLTLDINEKDLQLVDENVNFNKISLDKFMNPSDIKDAYIVAYYRQLAKQQNSTLEDGSDALRTKAYEIYCANAMPFAIGGLQDLLKWNSFDVDLYEVQHNNSVYSHNSSEGRGTQGNRNPFVDYPQLVNYAFGDLRNQSGSIANLEPTYLNLEMDQNEIHHYQIDSTKEVKFNVGDQFDISKYDIKAIKNDLSQGTLDTSTFTIPEYTFVEGDVASGKTFEIATGKNTLTLKATVVSEGEGGGGGETTDVTYDTAKYSFTMASKPQDLVVNGVANWGDLKWDFEMEHDVTLGSSNGLKIGTASAAAGTVTMTTQSSLEDVDAIFFKAYCASGKTYQYDIYVGADKVADNVDMTGAAINEYSKVLSTKKTGKVKIVFKNLDSYVSLKGIAINYK